MLSHRAGRWSFNEVYARALFDQGYQVDCSVTPHVSWAKCQGNPSGPGGTDFSDFPEGAYCMDVANIRTPLPAGAAECDTLIEVPMTIVQPRYGALQRATGAVLRKTRPGAGVANRLFPRIAWLRPNGRNGAMMRAVLDAALDEGRDYVEFMLHSSEFMAGGSPTFPTTESIETLYRDMEALFEAAAGRMEGLGLAQYGQRIGVSRPSAPAMGNDYAAANERAFAWASATAKK
jgi:hypothetical protein